MIDDEIQQALLRLSLEQLEYLKNQLDQKIKEAEASKKKAMRAPPRTSNDLSQLAEMAGLDISSLMREISKSK